VTLTPATVDPPHPMPESSAPAREGGVSRPANPPAPANAPPRRGRPAGRALVDIRHPRRFLHQLSPTRTTDRLRCPLVATSSSPVTRGNRSRGCGTGNLPASTQLTIGLGGLFSGRPGSAVANRAGSCPPAIRCPVQRRGSGWFAARRGVRRCRREPFHVVDVQARGLLHVKAGAAAEEMLAARGC